MLGSTTEPVGSSIMSGGIGEDDKADGGGGGGGEFYEGDRSTGGNRWPKQEALALLKIRSDMDAVFRDSTLKGPLWEDVSRKMGELGYHRSSKKCKEKFENVYKYHKRTKDGRVGKSDGKTYRFFEELQALEQLNPSSSSSSFPQPQPEPVQAAVPVSMVIPAGTNPVPAGITVTSSVVTPITAQPHVTRVIQQQQQQQCPVPPTYYSSPSITLSSSSLSGSDEDEVVGTRRRRKKRKWKEFFERLTKEVIDKQEELQKRFLEAIEKRERDRLVRDEAWRTQEVNRLNREHDVLVQERSMAAAKDAALMQFLQKLCNDPRIVQSPNVVTGTADLSQPSQKLPNKSQVLPAAIPIQAQPQPQPQSQPQPQPSPTRLVNTASKAGGENDPIEASSSRWPKAEVEALISLRTQLDEKYQENGPKGPLWEEISANMKKLGYNRNTKRCKEKWENINKYFKKVKESNKRRPEDSKTCPYFHQLDALYRGKTPRIDNVTSFSPTSVPQPTRVENLTTVARAEQRWQGGNDSGDDEDNDYDDDDEGSDVMVNF
ncbi:trihelix transcription factor DF1-like isoform X2 [Silene latifolia]|uniref:trihelix transcription factor DF1-like isoform X2 n=1 Tax=Silene latifolia TaxID=37657 RepID=UPI003D787182